MKKTFIIYNCFAWVYIIISIIYIFLFLFSRLYSIRLIGDNTVYVNVGSDYFENGYVATILKRKD